MTRKRLYIDMVVAMLMAVSLTGCFTGVESTPRVTQRDVERATASMSKTAPATLTLPADSLPAWRVGKRFYVCDNQARLLFDHAAAYDVDTLHLEHRTIAYAGYTTGGVLDNRATVNMLFTYGPDTLVYRTGRTPEQFGAAYTIPLLIDMDMVAAAHRRLAGHEYYVKSSIWYDIATEQMTAGRHYIKVHIDSVLPGNKVLPLRVCFTALDRGERAMMWVATDASMRNRDFDALFTSRDPRADYPDIRDATWQLIVEGRVTEDMTKQECRLAMGAPKRITPIHNQMGVREYWYYDGGTYLLFVDGLLKEYRR